MNNLAHNADPDLFKLTDNFLTILKDGPLAIAVSGGSDSMAVLDLLAKANVQNRKLYCFTVDHGLRKEAKQEAQFVADFCKNRNIEHQILIWDGEKPKTGLQNAARWARYQLLNQACDRIGAVGLLTGHNLDDQFETVYMRMQRDKNGDGTGLSGMASAALFFNNMWVLRPYLTVGKQQLKDHLKRSSLKWMEDPSNLDETFERVRVRHQADYDFDLRDIANHAANRKSLSHDAASYLCEFCSTEDNLVFDLRITDHDQLVLEKVLEALVHLIGGRVRSISGQDIKSLYDFALSQENARMTMGRVILDKFEDRLRLFRENRGFEDFVLKPGEQMNWDGRFLIKNNSRDQRITISHDGDQSGCPPVVKQQNCSEIISAFTCDFLSVKPVINKYDQVLPEFDLELANSLALLIGRSNILMPYDNAKVQIQV